MKPLASGPVIGILGGGQLGRMTAMAAARLGIACHIYCPENDVPALDVCAVHTQAAFDDVEALTRFAKAVDVVTLEWENVPLAALEILARHVQVRPGPDVLRIAQDRGLEKAFARRCGIGTATFAVVRSVQELAEALENFTRPCILKSTRMGYDGKGQVRIDEGMTAAQAWTQMGSNEGILEAFVDFEHEVSVIVARRADGVMAAYPAVLNIHRNHILVETHAPAPLSVAVLDEADELAKKMAKEIGVVGLLAIEMFVLKTPNEQGHRLLINEIAPRPHNSGHWTIDACSCSQFEMLVRAVCDLPLGNPEPHHKAVMYNILGDESSKFEGWLTDPSACLHLYGKKEAREGRKMGHVTMLQD